MVRAFSATVSPTDVNIYGFPEYIVPRGIMECLQIHEVANYLQTVLVHHPEGTVSTLTFPG